MDLDLDEDELSTCVACGLCLPHCPTYRVTGEEAASPRGRIAAMRAVQRDGAAADDTFAGFMTACVQCRGCETACPSGVPFGRLMSTTRETLAGEGPERPESNAAAGRPARPLRWGLAVLGHPKALRALTVMGALGQRLGVIPSARLGMPGRLPLRRAPLVASPDRDDAVADEVWLFTGCVMDAWQRPVHAAAQRVLEAAGARVRFPGDRAACCGALHEHAGLGEQARRLAERTMAAFPGEAPVLVDSAGCGAMLRGYDHLLGTPAAETFSARVLDVHEWLAAHVDRLTAQPHRRLTERVAVQDPCHLRHVQRAHQHVRTVLVPFADLAELDDEGLCCGAGGAYALAHAEMAGAIRDRKVAAIERTGAPVVASANPGCSLHLQRPLAERGITIRHPVELIDDCLA